MDSLALTLLVALVAALVLGAIAHRLRLPPMIGYVAAGIVVGPATPGFVADPEQLLVLADVGVALLMFSIGLQFRLSELREVGREILIGTPIQVLVTMALGTSIGLLLGWSLVESLFIGGAVSVCSTVVLVKVAGEATLNTTRHGRTAIAVSITQDLVTVVLFVGLAALGSRQQETVATLIVSTSVALGFVGLVVFGGSRALPRLLGVIAGLRSRELFVIGVAVVAIGTAFLAQELGVSIALGAFVAGLALADSDLSASVLGEIVPLRELFSTFFFVSIGLLLQPGVIAGALPVVLALLVVITLGKAIPIALLARLDGQRPTTALRSGALIGQSGEFSFVIASAGLSFAAVASETFSVAMAAVVLSILTAEPLYMAAGVLGKRLEEVVGEPSLPEEGPPPDMRRHAIILGYGRVGRAVARVLEARDFAWLAIDGDYATVREAREAGAPVLYGEVGAPSVLDQANVAQCRIVVVAIPDALATRQAVAYCRSRNPRAEVVARAHSEGEEIELRRMGVARVVVAEREVGNELVRYALHRFGVSEREVAALLGPRRQ